MSEGIDRLLDLAKGEGIVPADNQTGQWEKAFVYGFKEVMPAAVRIAGKQDSSLDYRTYEGTPHSRPDECFIDRKAKVAISFAKG